MTVRFPALMHRRFARTASIAVVVVASIGAAGCGDKEAIVHEAETEGIYLDVGGLDYQVQISRQVNPTVVPDRDYLNGLPEFVGEPDEDETWFAVFVRVQNQTDEPHESAEEFEIVDTQEKSYSPIELEPEQNALAYQPVTLAPGEVLPGADDLSGDSPTQGKLLLFKITYESLQNRPLILKIEGQEGEEAEVDLDV